jgi:hypothetical protein
MRMSKISYSPMLDLPVKESFRLQFRRTRLRAQAPRPATAREREIWNMAREAAAESVEIQEASHRGSVIAARLTLIQQHGAETLRAQGCPWVDDITY